MVSFKARHIIEAGDKTTALIGNAISVGQSFVHIHVPRQNAPSLMVTLKLVLLKITL